MEDVHRAGGVMAILGELDRAGLLHTDCQTIYSDTMAEALNKWDIVLTQDDEVRKFFRGGPGMQEMLYPTSYLKSKGLGKACALLTDGRFSGGTSGLSIGYASPEAAAGGAIALVQAGDIIEIDIPARTINVALSDEVLAARRADMGAVRDLSLL